MRNSFHNEIPFFRGTAYVADRIIRKDLLPGRQRGSFAGDSPEGGRGWIGSAFDYRQRQD